MKIHGYSDVLIGLQYGDEGKARVVDLMAKDYDIIARFNGGANAGHTIVFNGIKIALHQVPSGVFYEDKELYIGSGCVVDIVRLAKEIEEIESHGLSLKGRFRISSQCSLIQPHHIMIDTLTGGKIGTTNRGIGPCYADKARRMIGDRIVNIRIGDLHHEPNQYFQAIQDNFVAESRIWGQHTNGNVAEEMNNIKNAFEKIKDFVEVDTLWMEKQVYNGKKVLFEGAQSAMLDITKGAIPFVTSSSTIASAAYVGGDLSVKYHRKVIGVAKALMSRVGNGPFTSELGGSESEKYASESNPDGTTKNSYSIEKSFDIDSLIKSDKDFDIGTALRILSYEYGSTTGRPRRVGFLDLVQLKYSARMNGVDEIVITKMDVLKEFARTKKNSIPLVVKYSLNNREIDFIPASASSYYRTTGTILEMDCFTADIQNVKDLDKLPIECQKLVKFIEEYTECKIVGLGVGPEREQYVEIKK
jgi:adenylosuccinate synthase